MLCSTGALAPGVGYADLCRLGRTSRALARACADGLPLAWAACTGDGVATAVGVMLCRAAETGHSAHAAAIAGGPAGRQLLEDGSGVAAQCLGRAACAGHFATVDALLCVAGRGLLFAKPFAGGKSALHLVASCPAADSAAAAEQLLRYGGAALAGLAAADGSTALHYAVAVEGHYRVVDALLCVVGAAHARATSHAGTSVLHAAVAHSASLAVIERVVAVGGRELVLLGRDRGVHPGRIALQCQR